MSLDARKLGIFLVLSAILCAGLWKLSWVGEYRDDVAYIAAARGMAQGYGYSTMESVRLMPEVKYPPGLPLLLLPVELFAGGSLTAMRMLTSLTGLGVLALIWRGVPRHGPQVAVLTGLNPYFLLFCSKVMPAVPFTLLVFGTLVKLYQVQEKKALTTTDRIQLALLVAAAPYIRTIGVALFFSLVVGLWRKGWKSCLAVCLYAGGFMMPYFLLSRVSGYRGDLETYPGLWAVIKENAQTYFWVVSDLALGSPFLFQRHGNFEILHGLVCLLLMGLMVRGLWMDSSTTKQIDLVTLAVFTGVLLIWPFQYPRFFLPILPLMYRYMLSGWNKLPKIPNVIFFVLIVAQLGFYGWEIRKPGRENPSYYSWLAENLEPGDVVGTSERALWLHLNHQVLLLSASYVSSRPEPWLNEVYSHPTKYVVAWDGIPNASVLFYTIRLFPNHLQLVHESPEDGAQIFKVIGDPNSFRLAFARASKGLDSLRAGRAREAVQHLARAIEREPEMITPRVFLAEALLDLNRNEEALRILNDVLARDPYNRLAQDLLQRIR